MHCVRDVAEMLTPKCRSRDSRVRARADIVQNRLCYWDQNLSRQNLAGFCEKLGHTVRPALVPGRRGKAWLCWQSEANRSLPAKLGHAGRFRKNAARAETDLRRKCRYLNVLCAPLPNVAIRENPVHSREANTANKVFGTHSDFGIHPVPE